MLTVSYSSLLKPRTPNLIIIVLVSSFEETVHHYHYSKIGVMTPTDGVLKLGFRPRTKPTCKGGGSPNCRSYALLIGRRCDARRAGNYAVALLPKVLAPALPARILENPQTENL